MDPRFAVLVATLALLPFAADAQSYRCVGKDGKKYYGQNLPTECLGQPAEQLNRQGMVIKRIDPQASAAERAKKESEDEDRKKRESVSKEEGRRNRALLATYTSDKDIEQSRARALQDNEAAVKEIEGKIAALKKRQADLQKELAASKGGKNAPSPRLAQDIKGVEFDIKTQEDLLAAKKKDVDAINARYNDDKRRYNELTKGSK